MIDWLKYLPLDLRDGKNTDSVKGPTFSSARPVKLEFKGNVIRLQAPRHRFNSDEPQIYIRGIKAHLANEFRTWRGATENWEYSTLFYRCWDYRREWFGGVNGSLTISASVLTRKEGEAFEGSSFFYPGAFESAMSNYLNTTNGVHSPGTIFTKRAPVNWQVHHHLPVFSGSFELWKEDNLVDIFFFYPLTDQHLGVIRFAFYIDLDADEAIAQARELISQIINSVQLELSAESQAQLDQAKQAMGELKLSAEFAPLKWPIKIEEIEQPLATDSFLPHT